MRKHGRFERQKPKKGKKALKIFLIILAVLVVILGVVAFAGIRYYNNMMSKINYVEMPKDTTPVETTLTAVTEDMILEATAAATEATTVETTRPDMKPEDIINVLVIGQASRAGEDSRLADTMILVSMNTYTKTMTLTSILRDAYVKLPDYKGHTCGRSKMTYCYNLGYQWGGGTPGGFEMTNICLRNNFGIEVDYDVEIDFESFVEIVNIMGGVEVELTQAEADYLNDDDLYCYYDVEPGLVRLDGLTALSYARMRKAEGDSDSDIKRTARQRNLIQSLIGNVRNMSLLELQEMANSALPYITTNMPADEITKTLLKVLPMVSDLKIESGTCPTNGWGELVDIFKDGTEHSVIKFDQGENTQYMRAITEGEVTQTSK